MNRTLGRWAIGAAAALLAGLAPATPALASQPGCGGSGSVTTQPGTLPGRGDLRDPVPGRCLERHAVPVQPRLRGARQPQPGRDVGDPATAAWMLGHGYALAGSSYATTGWAIQQALPDQIATLDVFDRAFGTPARTVAWGHSLGGIITAGLIQRYPGRFSAALPMCGVLSGGVATWNTALDAEFVFQQLIDPQVRWSTSPTPPPTWPAPHAAADGAQATPQGRARLALAAALGDTPGWFTPLSPEPAATDYAGQEANQFLWDTQVDFPFIFAFAPSSRRARAGTRPGTRA